MMFKSNLFKLVISIIIPLGLGSIAGMFTAEAVPEWFATLNRPSFSPPNWLFGPVWTILYLLLGFSFFLIWKQPATKARKQAIIVYVFHLMLNFGWSFFFFYFNMIGLALVEIILLWMNIVVMLVLFHRVKPIAAYINIPYLLWVSFATVLNASYYVLN